MDDLTPGPKSARWRDALCDELLGIVFNFPNDVAAFTRTAAALGFDPATPRVALALKIDLSELATVESGLNRIAISVARCQKIAITDLVSTLHHGHVVVWLPTLRGDSVLATDALMRTLARELFDVNPNIHAMGIGLMGAGALGWASSANEAMRALEAGRRLNGTGVASPYSDFVLEESVLRSDNALRYLDAIIDRLSHEQDLLHTLAVFFESGQHRKHASEHLGIHPNTLNYRLGRIEEILGAKLDDAHWQAKLHVAIQLRRASERVDAPDGESP
ncbi:PucR family transcriptional regulator [Pinirhizobacter sp.]|jgi:sugar diacid utilization regulator|uniref:PucR family transcriptional regulator n=1 Tax=Pinirhizobacter sp. TaxID=2950432 RepID=UPI002F40FFAD